MSRILLVAVLSFYLLATPAFARWQAWDLFTPAKKPVDVLDGGLATDGRQPFGFEHLGQTISLSRYARGDVRTSRPLIGILTQPCSLCPGRSYISAGYARWIEAAGGRAVPMRFYDSDRELYRLFKSVNALIFPGGLTWLWLDSPYVITARKLYNWAVEENQAGNPFPIHGACLGHQLLQILASNVSRDDLLVRTDAVSHPTTLKLTEEAASSEYFGSIAPDLVEKLQDSRYNIAMENHEYGVPPHHYDRWPILKDAYRILSTTVDRNGNEYISTIESTRYPFFGTQWHPEKPPYEFSDKTIPHSLDAIRVSQHTANAFVEVARRSSHRPESIEEELAMLIYSDVPIFTARFDAIEESYDGPDITYFFDVEDRKGQNPFPSGPFPSDGGRDENSTAAEYARSYRVGRTFGIPSTF